MKKNGIARAIEYGKHLTKELSPKIHYLAGYNQAVEDYNSIEADAIQDVLATEIMVLREKNAELVDMLEKSLGALNDCSMVIDSEDEVFEYVKNLSMDITKVLFNYRTKINVK